eukprot:1372133-Amphidinium_carterae.1
MSKKLRHKGPSAARTADCQSELRRLHPIPRKWVAPALEVCLRRCKRCPPPCMTQSKEGWFG